MGLTSTDRARTLQRLHARIRACTKCVAAGYLERARPVVAGSIRDRIAIVGQAPGAVEGAREGVERWGAQRRASTREKDEGRRTTGAPEETPAPPPTRRGSASAGGGRK